MAAVLKPFLALLPVFLLLGVCWLLFVKLRLQDLLLGGGLKSRHAAPAYRTRPHVLSPGERAFLPVLHDALHILATDRGLSLPHAFPSVRLAEIFETTSNRSADASGWQSAFNRIQSKQIDFVICDPDSTRPLLIIELDDRTHSRPSRADRDDLLDSICHSAGLPILHVRAAMDYSPRRLAADIADALARTSTPTLSPASSRSPARA